MAMRWSWPIGRIAGIPLRVHVTFPLLVGWIALMQWRSDGNLAAVASIVLMILLIFTIVVLHELGHALAARRYGVGTRDITLLPIGGVARLERMPKEPRQELVIALAGPAVNVGLALVIGAVVAVTGSIGSLTDLARLLEADPAFDLRLLAVRLVAINIWLVAFNMLPAFPMDGGRVLRALLAMRFRDHTRATIAAARVGRVFAVLFGGVGLFVVNSPLLVLIAVFVWISGSGEAAVVQQQAALDGVSLAALMMTDVRTVRADDSLARATQLVIDGSQHDFPVVDGDRYLGMLGRADLVRGLTEHGRDGRIADVMRHDGPVIDHRTDAEHAIAVVTAARGVAVPVLQSGRLVGMLTSENVMEFLMIQRALRTPR